MSDKSEAAANFLNDLGGAAQKNPISAALIGMGVLWLFGAGRSIGVAGELLHRAGVDRLPGMAMDGLSATGSGLRSAAESVSDGLVATAGAVRAGGSSTIDRASQAGSEYVDRASQAASEYVDHAGSYARGMSESGSEWFDDARSNLGEVLDRQPLLLGAIGLAIGAGIAAAIPTTDIEGAYFGETSDLVKTRAMDMAGEQFDHATTVASDAIDAATQEARKQNLTTDGVRSAVGGITDKIERVVSAAKSGSENAG